MHEDLRVTKHGTNVGGDAHARIGRADDWGDVERPKVAQPAVGPAAEEDEAAGLGVVRHARVLARHGELRALLAVDEDRGLGPHEAAAVHDVDGVGEVHHALLAHDRKHLVVGDALDGLRHVVAEDMREGLRHLGRVLLPRERVQVQEAHLVEDLRVVAPPEDHQVVGEPGGAVVEPRDGLLALSEERPLPPRHLCLRVAEVENPQVAACLAVALVPSEDVDLVIH
mmetsp:Transcript_15761/g.49527  ORF Transcript_15761/g.49527 Transcript_15761/m.49527 type:complete len:226 (-) Transcript_15761:507-1184(-)